MNQLYNTELFNTFGIIRDPLKPFVSNSLCLLQRLQRHLLLFFVVLTAEHLESSALSRESYIQLSQKKVPEYFFWKLQIAFVEFYNHYWPWNKSGEKVEYKIREKERKTRDVPRSKPQKKRRKCL